MNRFVSALTLLRTGSTQGIRHSVVAFVARVLKLLVFVVLLKIECDCPRVRVCIRVINGQLVPQGILIDQGEPLNNMSLWRMGGPGSWSSLILDLAKIGRLNN